MPKDSEKITKNSGIQKQEIRVDQNFGQLRLKLGGKTESKQNQSGPNTDYSLFVKKL